ncbi:MULTISPECIES: twin-arginine translocase subunit TatC [Bacillaceae]|uniref:Sec-independent protein translocase protein TatC n=1 Tax=Domibacillus aminovorans TaxID=29332 RepID=A0A177KHI5_9BACI|nr:MULTISPECIES: twin-arginine translocase subunit TatC [Bacillaceae]OAH52853.1 preprotein translocase subunit TatC [Domibacillus aminovorans]
MDPYGDHNRKVLSPLDKVSMEEVAVSQVQESAVTDRPNELSELGASLVEHLTDLRKQLIKSTVVFLFFFIIVFSSINFWFPYVTRGHELIILGPLEVIKFYMSISLALSLGLSLPFVSHFLWQFVKPGLNEKESRFIGFYSPAMLLLFIAGVAFGYFVVNPLSYQFLISMGSLNFNVMVSAQEYIRFLLMSTVPLGLLFEMPIIALFLAAIGILTAETMRKVRKWSYLIIAVLSAAITPPDFISQLLVMFPMILLYEISIYIVTFIERRRAKSEHIHILNETNE